MSVGATCAAAEPAVANSVARITKNIRTLVITSSPSLNTRACGWKSNTSTGSDGSTVELSKSAVNGISTVIALTVEIGSHYYPQRLEARELKVWKATSAGTLG